MPLWDIVRDDPDLAWELILGILGEDGREVPAGTDGRLWIKFRGNMVGYWNNP